MRQELKDLKVFKGLPKGYINLATNEISNDNWSKIINYQEILEDYHLAEYGNSQHIELLNAYSNYLKIDANKLLVGSGSDSLIPLLINSLSNKNILTITKDFFRYKDAGLVAKRNVYQVNHSDNLFGDILKSIKDKDIELVILSNPNNPLGIIYPKEDIQYLLDNTNCYVIIDEAYMEFGNQSCIDLIDHYNKLIILRTLSKAWGLAKIRVGFALTNSSLIEYLKAIQGPFALSDINASIALKALEHQDILNNNISEIKQVRDAFIKQLDKKINVYLSHTNFVYLESDNSDDIHKELLENRILVVKYDGALRISIGTLEVMEQVASIINNIVKEGN